MAHSRDALVWFRRDLRCADHTALAAALSENERVWCAFVFDREILDALCLEHPQRDRRVEFIRASIIELDQELRRAGGGLIVRHGYAVQVIPALAQQLCVDAVYANHDYEPAAIHRDLRVEEALARVGRSWRSYKDQVIFEKDEILTAAGGHFSVFTPYKRAWLKRLGPSDVAERSPAAAPAQTMAAIPSELEEPIPSLEAMGFAPTNLSELHIHGGASGASHTLEAFLPRLDAYRERRDYPGVKGPSYLSIHLRFGTISIRSLVRACLAHMSGGANPGAETWLSELIWREFYMQILYHRPDVTTRAFKTEYDAIQWETGPLADARFAAWCAGQTGFPLVDAAMHQINQTGYMHNRLRMVVASFLVKDLGVDWRRGEAYFARHLNDFDLAANNGGWQWAASTGCDAQPYFRIFNPTTQSEKFDPEGSFIRRYLPVLADVPKTAVHNPSALTPDLQRAYGCILGTNYPLPIVEHRTARERTLRRYAVVKANAAGQAISPAEE